MDHGALDLDQRVRLAAFSFLAEQTQLHGQVLPYATLLSGFTFDGTRVPLLGPQGIFKPAILPEIPISITTVPVVEGKPRPQELVASVSEYHRRAGCARMRCPR